MAIIQSYDPATGIDAANESDNNLNIKFHSLETKMGHSKMTEHVLDAKGMNCPLPILHAKKKLKDVPVGEILSIEATDPGAVADFEAFCRQTGHELVEHTMEGDVYLFKIKSVG